MLSPIPDYLNQVLDTCAADSGELAEYIPELAAVDPDRFALSLVTAEGDAYSVGDHQDEFTIQSISKPFVYGLALETLGFEAVLDRVGVEPSGESFSEISLERNTGRPLNPMINAGALAAHALVASDASADIGVERIRKLLSAMAGRELDIDEKVARSELDNAYRNIALSNLLRSYDVFTGDPDAVVEGYIRQCAVRVTTADLGMMAATLASGGIQPHTGEEIFSRPVVRQVLSVMATCGMYDAAGDWLTTIGIPAKSGVSGGIIGILPGQLGIAVFSPRLDSHGTSARGVQVCEHLSRDMNLHLMDAPMVAHSVMRRRREFGDGDTAVTLLVLQGDLQFTNAEALVRDLIDEPIVTPRLVLDLALVRSVFPAGSRVLLEVVRRLHLDGIEVMFIDPEEHFPDPEVGSGYRPLVLESIGELPMDLHWRREMPGRVES
ncbi:glutaminase [Rhodococcus sp. NPDC060090]|uniref:glutaminase n=1 Tax=Rhodococcus sp. NPDC060090 TaxID=3347056 RepID=UPI00364CC869